MFTKFACSRYPARETLGSLSTELISRVITLSYRNFFISLAHHSLLLLPNWGIVRLKFHLFICGADLKGFAGIQFSRIVDRYDNDDDCRDGGDGNFFGRIRPKLSLCFYRGGFFSFENWFGDWQIMRIAMNCSYRLSVFDVCLQTISIRKQRCYGAGMANPFFNRMFVLFVGVKMYLLRNIFSGPFGLNIYYITNFVLSYII